MKKFLLIFSLIVLFALFFVMNRGEDEFSTPLEIRKLNKSSMEEVRGRQEEKTEEIVTQEVVKPQEEVIEEDGSDPYKKLRESVYHQEADSQSYVDSTLKLEKTVDDRDLSDEGNVYLELKKKGASN